MKYLKYYIIFICTYFAQNIYSLPDLAFSNYLKNTLHISYSNIAIISSITVLPWVIKFIYGFLLDKFHNQLSYKKLFLLCFGFIFVSSFFFGFFSLPLYIYIIFLFFTSTFAALNDTASDGLMVRVGQKEGLTGNFNSIQWIAASITGLFTGILGGFISQYYSFHYAYKVLMIIFGVLFFAYLIFLKDIKIKYQRINIKFKDILNNKKLINFGLFLLFLWSVPAFGSIFLNTILRDKLKFTEISLGYLGAIESVACVCGAILYYFIHKKLNFIKLLKLIILIEGITTFFYLYCPNKQIVIIYSIIVGIFSTFSQVAILDFISKIIPKKNAAFLFASFCGILNLGSMIGKVSGGLLYKIMPLNGLIIISGCWTLFGLIYYKLIKKYYI